MFEKLDEKITSLKDYWEEASIKYHFYDNKNNSAFILTIATPLTIRVQKMVSQLFVLLTTVTLFVNIALLCKF